MKNIFIYLAAVIVFTSVSPAQNPQENLLENVDLEFSMPGEPTPEKIGFDNPKSYWKLQYELVLSDSFALEKLGRCERIPDYRLHCPLSKDRKMSRKMRRARCRSRRASLSKEGRCPNRTAKSLSPSGLRPR